MRRNQPPGQNGIQRPDRHRHHPSGHDRRRLHPGIVVPHQGDNFHLRPRLHGLHHRIGLRRAVRETIQPRAPRVEENQPAHRQCRRICRADVSTNLQQPRPRIRSLQLPAHACHGTERSRSNRLGRSSRRSPRLPRRLIALIVTPSAVRRNLPDSGAPLFLRIIIELRTSARIKHLLLLVASLLGRIIICIKIVRFWGILSTKWQFLRLCQ